MKRNKEELFVFLIFVRMWIENRPLNCLNKDFMVLEVSLVFRV